MMIHLYSDLHLEWNHGWKLPKDLPGELVILAGDIITFNNFEILERFLQGWDKPAIFVPGNHEYYTKTPMVQAAQEFRSWLAKTLPHVVLLTDAAISLEAFISSAVRCGPTLIIRIQPLWSTPITQ